jgi:hypothetical protein
VTVRAQAARRRASHGLRRAARLPTASRKWNIDNVGNRFIANPPAFSVKIVDSAA